MISILLAFVGGLGKSLSSAEPRYLLVRALNEFVPAHSSKNIHNSSGGVRQLE